MHSLFITTLYVLLLKVQLVIAQTFVNPLSNPGCSTGYSIVSSCFTKFGAAAWATAPTSAAFSCICFDSSGNYIPNGWDDAASACTSFLETAYTVAPATDLFGAYVAGFCTSTSLDPTLTDVGVATTSRTSAITAGPGPIIVTTLSSFPATSSAPTSTPGGDSNTGPITSSPTSSSASLSGSGSGAGASVSSSSSSSAEAGRISALDSGSFWSILGTLVAGIFMF